MNVLAQKNPMRNEAGIVYSNSHCDIRRLDLFVPKQPNGCGMLCIHGGGWKTGSREVWHYMAEHLCREGYVCASCSYRLAPQHPFPAQIEDVRLAMAWLRSRAAELGCSPDKLAVFGSSAGGHLAALLATIGPGDELGRTDELASRDTRPNAVVCDCPVTFFDRPAAANIGGVVRDLFGATQAEAPERYREAAPIERVTGEEPPFLLVHGEMDKQVVSEHSTAFDARLTAAGVPVELILIPNLAHGFAFNRKCQLHLEIYEQMKLFLRRHLCDSIREGRAR